MSPSPSGAVRRLSPRPSPWRLPLLGALFTGLMLLGAPAHAATPAKKKPAATKKKAATAPSKKSEDAQALYDDGAKLIRGKQFPEAEALAKRCIDANPQFAPCHMLRGSALAGMGRPEDAAQEYRTFLSMAPNDPLAPKVRTTVEQYERAGAPQ